MKGNAWITAPLPPLVLCSSVHSIDIEVKVSFSVQVNTSYCSLVTWSDMILRLPPTSLGFIAAVAVSTYRKSLNIYHICMVSQLFNIIFSLLLD